MVVVKKFKKNTNITYLDKNRTEIHLEEGRNIIDINSYPGLRYGWKVSRGWGGYPNIRFEPF